MKNNMAEELYRSEKENNIRLDFYNIFKNCPLPNDSIMQNLGLFINSKLLSRILFLDHIYKISKDSHGIIMEFGTRWGNNVSIFSALRGIYEPFNRMRKIIAFDTFTGFPEITKYDNNKCSIISKGGLSCTKDYEKYLDKILYYQEQDNPVSHIKKYDIIKGDATKELPKYLKKHPETIISLAYFDFDIYEPTKQCLKLIKDRLVKGSVVAFDELCDSDSPGETIAVKEVLGLNNIKIKRFPYASRVSYYVVGE